MPLPPSIRKSIQDVRTFIASGGEGACESEPYTPYTLCRYIFQAPCRILEDSETLDAVLALGLEIEAYRGKGSRIIQRDYNRQLDELLFRARMEVVKLSPLADFFSSLNEPANRGADAPFWVERLSDYFFERVQRKDRRSQHAASLRSGAWLALAELSHLLRRPEHLTLALKTAAEKRNSSEERRGAIQFLRDYWAEEAPDKATIDLFESVRVDAPDRSFLIFVLDAQIDLGLIKEFEALGGLDDWDDAEEERRGVS